ncbi:MAG: DegT/DnrJ/EryC1/StrS family aminotransferase [Bryobacteraceae bacterium]
MSTVSARPIPLLDLQAQHRQVREQALAAVTRVIDSQKFILGEEVKKLEEEIASYSSTKFAIGCASGSDALLLALMALDCGPGHEVVTTPFTFFATGGAIARTGATPVFVDIDPNTFNLEPNLLEDALKKHANVRAVLPVHLFGQCADMDPLLALAQSRGIAVIEDAAQSIGAEYKGRRAGSLGDMGCLSFFPSKNLGAYGDGGMVTTNDERLARKLAALRVHGGIRKYYHEWVGINSRLDALQAAVLRVKFQYLDSWTAGRQRNADLYRKMLAELQVPVVAPQAAAFTSRHIYNQFTIRCKQRDALQAYLKQNGIGTEIYYPLPLHLQACFSNLGYRAGDLPLSEQVAAEALSVPIYPELPAEDIEQVCRTIQAFYSQR